MKNKTLKKLMVTLLTGALCAGMTMAVYAAPSGERPAAQDGQQMGQPPRDGQMKGQPPQDGQMKGQPPQGELPDGAEEGERPELPEGVEEGERPELPEGVSDNGTQRSGRHPEMKGERPEREKPEGDLPEEDELPAGAAGNKTIDKAQKEKTGEASGADTDTKTTPQADTSSEAKTKGSSEGKKNALTGKLSELYNWLKGIFG